MLETHHIARLLEEFVWLALRRADGKIKDMNPPLSTSRPGSKRIMRNNFIYFSLGPFGCSGGKGLQDKVL
ncbi:MAG: hypothetical protein H0X40_17215 [Chthoniobacterales bacterium]|nr:hypothetical protein [Chthoniobacterales bacterium]